MLFKSKRNGHNAKCFRSFFKDLEIMFLSYIREIHEYLRNSSPIRLFCQRFKCQKPINIRSFVCIFTWVFKEKMMETITIYPKNEKQKSLLKSLLEEMKIPFDIAKSDDTLMNREEFYGKIDRSIQQAKEGNVKALTKEKQKELLGL